MTRGAWCALVFSAACSGPSARPATEVDAGPPDAALPTGPHARPGYHLVGLTGARTSLALSVGPNGVAIGGDYGGGFVQAGRTPGTPAAFDGSAWTSLAPTAFDRIDRVVYDGNGTLWGMRNLDNCALGLYRDDCTSSHLFRYANGWQLVADTGQAAFDRIVPLADGFLDAGGLTVLRVTAAGVEDLNPGVGNTFLDVATRAGRICITSRVNHNTTYTNSIRCYDNGAWAQQGDAFPADYDDQPTAVAILGDGSLVAATVKGVFALAGTTWTPIAGAPTGVTRLAADGQTIYAGGTSLQRYDGAWTAIDVISDRGSVRIDDIAVGDGGVYIAGNFDIVEGRVASGVAKLGHGALLDAGDHPLGTGGDVRALLADPAGTIAAGAMHAMGETLVANVAQLRADGWHALGDPGAPIHALIRRADNSIVAGTTAGALLTWDGAAWTPIAPARDGAIEALLEDGATLLAAGKFTGGVARWDGTAWSAIGVGTTIGAFALGRNPAGRICVGMQLASHGLPLICQTDTGWAADPGVNGWGVAGIYALPDHSVAVAGLLDDGALQSTADGGWSYPRSEVPLPYGASFPFAHFIDGWSLESVQATLPDGTFAAPGWTKRPPYAQGFGVADL